MGTEVINQPAHSAWFCLASTGHLQSVIFLQLVANGPLLLFVVRSKRWFFQPPIPAAPPFCVIVSRQVIALLLRAFGRMVEPIWSTLIGAIWTHKIAWMLVMGGVRLVTERFAEHRSSRHMKSVNIVNQSLHSHALTDSRKSLPNCQGDLESAVASLAPTAARPSTGLRYSPSPPRRCPPSL